MDVILKEVGDLNYERILISSITIFQVKEPYSNEKNINLIFLKASILSS